MKKLIVKARTTYDGNTFVQKLANEIECLENAVLTLDEELAEAKGKVKVLRDALTYLATTDLLDFEYRIAAREALAATEKGE